MGEEELLPEELREQYEQGKVALERLLEAIHGGDPGVITDRMADVAALGGRVTFGVAASIAGIVAKAQLGYQYRNMNGWIASPRLAVMEDGSQIPLDEAPPFAALATQFVSAVANEDMENGLALFLAATDLGAEGFTDFLALIVGNATKIVQAAKARGAK